MQVKLLMSVLDSSRRKAICSLLPALLVLPAFRCLGVLSIIGIVLPILRRYLSDFSQDRD